MSNTRRPISAHFTRLPNQKARFIVGNSTNNTLNKPSTAHSKSRYRNTQTPSSLGLSGNKIRSNVASDFSPTIKVTSLQPTSRKWKQNARNRPRPQTSKTNVQSRRMNESESNSRLLTYHHLHRKNYNKNAKHSYSSTSIGHSSVATVSTNKSKISSNTSDSVIFAIDPKYPLCPIVFRDEKSKTISRERLNLDNRNLSQCPILRGEENLRLLNYENNIITKISNLNNLNNLIFLDLYNNRIARIENLHCIPLLRVLMLGRNEITKIENLHNLQCLDVLDLHSNKISKIENLNHLHELRVLNLAGNEISNIENIHNLKNLVEINLRRNIIYKMESFITHQKLQRILLSNNNIRDMNSIVPLSFAKAVQQLTIDNNPFYDKFTHKSTKKSNIYSNPLNIKIICMFKSMKQLNNFEISETIKQKLSLNQSGLVRLDHDMDDFGIEDDVIEQDALLAQNNNLKENIQSNINSCNSNNTVSKNDKDECTQKSEINTDISDDKKPLMTEDELISKIKEEWNDTNDNSDLKHFKLDGNILKIYGCGVPDINGNNDYNNVQQIHFYYVDFNELTKYFNYLKTLKTITILKFNHNKIHCLYQIDALSVVSHITKISFGDNEITKTSPNVYRWYCIFRLQNIQWIDNKKVSSKEREMANKHFHLLRNQWKNSKILLTRGFCAPILNQIRNIDYNNNSNIHEIFKLKHDMDHDQNNHHYDINSDEQTEIYENKAKESIQHAINIYKSRQKIKEMWPSIVADHIQQVINDLQATSI